MTIRAIFLSAIIYLSGSIFSHATETSPAESIYKQEADSFLSRLPEGLQERQTKAIRLAIEGNTADLEAVRNSRNASRELPEGVTRRDIGEHLALYRHERYDNDTLPLLIYFHGGGWTIGSINSCARFCAAMADKGIAVLAVDYRLAPEHRFPAGLNDCISSVKTAADSLRTWKCRDISLGGDSSGGNLAIASALSFPENTFRSLIAFYPVTKAYADNSPSRKEYGSGFGLDSRLMDAFNDAYTADIHNPLVSPAEASDEELSALPPTLLTGAERDILRDQGIEFVERLKKLGKKAQYDLIAGSVHLFITVDGQTAAFNRAVSTAAEFILSTPND